MKYFSHILLTGGTGFFGRALLRTWCASFENGVSVPLVTILTRSPANFIDRYPEFSNLLWLKFHVGDIGEPDTLPRDDSFSHILHAATDSTLGPQLSPLQRFTQIVDGTRNMLEYAVARGAERFLLTSSGGVYGPQPPDMEKIPEDYHGMPDPLNPANAYSVAKRTAEHLCTLYHDAYDIEVVIARCFAFVGRDLPLDVHFAIGNFIRDAIHGSSIQVSGDGTPLRTYLDQEDLAYWLLALLERGRPGEAYNVGSDEVVSIAELAHRVRDLLAPEKSVEICGQSSDAQGRNRYVPDIYKAREELGLTVRIPLNDAIRRTSVAHWVGKRLI
ncbi:MAG: NAD(P)-dependent oxidoreductase [Candidatus Competibacter sp.]|nr:NAD(P)-dependent oxidoreductase [Candidatus Competibacter sp.]